jgi:outer membrane protein assembly factor BamD
MRPTIERMRYLTNALAGYEVHVARYYFNRGAYIAAANRAQATLTNYPKTPANEDALIVLVNSYDKLQLPQLRDDAQRILKETFPNANPALRAKSWWQFWAKDELPPPISEAEPWWKPSPAPADASKPWWKFW